MQAVMKSVAGILRLGDCEDYSIGTGLKIDGRGSGDADLRRDLSAGDGRSGFVGAEQRYFQQLRECVRVERVKAAVLGRHVEDVVNSLAGDGQARYVKWLCIDLAVHGEGRKAAEGGRVDVGGRQERLLQVLAGARAVVMPGKYAHLPAQSYRGEEHRCF